MKTKTCLFCRNTRLFNIHNDYGNNYHTAKDDMITFFGYQIESHLRPDDAICNLCMNIMENVAKLKKRLLPLIFREESSLLEDHKPVNFGKKWDVFASMNFDEDSDPFLESRSPTPSSLLKCKQVVPYETPLEMKIAEIERHRSMSRVSLSKSEADSEIAAAFIGKRSRRRRRGHNWTRRKNGRYSRTSVDTRKSVMSSYSRRSHIASRPISVMSTESYESFYPPASPVTVSSLTYVDGCLQNVRTRSVSRKQEEEVRVWCKDDELHQCCEQGCNFICEDIDLMAQHKISRHKQMALFWCSYCRKKYTSSRDLEIHNKTHAEPYSCVICHKEFDFETDLIQHWQGHVKKAVPCKYCGKRFVDTAIRDRHHQNVHKRKVPSRIDYNKSVEQNSVRNSDFEVRILVQNGNELLED